MATPLEILREQVLYWRSQAEAARETLQVVEGILPGMESQLRELENAVSSTRIEAQPSPAIRKISTGPAVSLLPAGDADSPPKGTAQTRISWAFNRWPAREMSVKDLISLTGNAFEGGAVGYVIRDLLRDGAIEQSRKVGNVRFYRRTQS